MGGKLALSLPTWTSLSNAYPKCCTKCAILLLLIIMAYSSALILMATIPSGVRQT